MSDVKDVGALGPTGASGLGRLLQVLHLVSGFVLITMTIVGPLKYIPYLSIFWLAMLTMYILHGGCILTRLERYLTGVDWTVVDPFLPCAEKSSDNRNTFTMLLGISMLLIGMIRLNFLAATPKSLY